MKEQIVVLENIRSAHNVGSIFRTADGAGVSQLYLVGYTPAPTDRFGREVPEIKKTSLGATHTVPWSVESSGVDVVRALQAQGVWVVVVEQTDNAVDFYDYRAPSEKPVAYIFGNEIDGVTPVVVAAANQVVEVPMYGVKESLNVAVTVGIVLYGSKQSYE